MFSTDELIRTCEICGCFCLYCCGCQKYFKNDGRNKSGTVCHHFRLIFTDGACRHNGRFGATAGIGVAIGTRYMSQVSVPINAKLDSSQKRTSQRAELLATPAGLRLTALIDDETNGESGTDDSESAPKVKQSKKRKGGKPRNHNPNEAEKVWIIATDSEYVVKGMTEWLPAWKPANLDLFLALDLTLAANEAKQDVKIGFWHVPREYNTIADRLAKNALLEGDLEEIALTLAVERVRLNE
ncbi:MAG: hypothetical protein Q9172_006570 [Xanthocarpia lactea]